MGYVQDSHAAENRDRNGGTSKETPRVSAVRQQKIPHTLQCTHPALHCSLDDLNSFNDIAKKCVERWKTQV